MKPNSKAIMAAPNLANARCRLSGPESAKYSMRMCRLRATAADAAIMVSTIIRNTETSSVQANEASVK